MSNCKGCGAEIIWIKTEKGKNMPIDAKPIKIYLSEQGGWNGIRYTLIDGHLPHWGTCPNARAFKKKNKKG